MGFAHEIKARVTSLAPVHGAYRAMLSPSPALYPEAVPPDKRPKLAAIMRAKSWLHPLVNNPSLNSAKSKTRGRSGGTTLRRLFVAVWNVLTRKPSEAGEEEDDGYDDYGGGDDQPLMRGSAAGPGGQGSHKIPQP